MINKLDSNQTDNNNENVAIYSVKELTLVQFLVATLHFAPSGVWLHFCALYPLHSMLPGLSSALCSLVSVFVYSALGHHALLLLHGAVTSLLNVNCATKPERMVRPRRRCGGGATHTNLRTHTHLALTQTLEQNLQRSPSVASISLAQMHQKC